MDDDLQGARWARGLVIAAAVIATIVITLIAWQLFLDDNSNKKLKGKGHNKDSKHDNITPVLTSYIKVSEMKQTLELPGSLSADRVITVSSEVSGILTELPWKVGDKIPAQTLLAQIDNRQYLQELISAQAEHALAEAEHNAAEQLLVVRLRQYQRLQELSQAASQEDLDQSQAALLNAQAEVAITHKRRELRLSAVANAQLRLDKCQLVSPDYPSLVAKQTIDPGTVVTPGDEIIELVSVEPLLVQLMVGENHLKYLHIGQKVLLTIPSLTLPDQQQYAHVSRIAPTVDQDTRQLLVELEVSSASSDALKPGMFVMAELTIAQLEQAIVVSESAIIGRQTNPHIFTVNKDIAKRWDISVLMEHDGQVAITASGLEHYVQSANPRVVVLGQHLLQDGTRVIASAIETNSEP